MSKQETMKIFERDTTITPRKLRSVGYIPATVYGKTTEPFSIQVKAHDFQLALARGVRRFTLDGLGKMLDVEVKQLQMVNVKDEVLHIEFYVPAAEGKDKAQKAASKKEAAPEVANVTVEEPVAVS